MCEASAPESCRGAASFASKESFPPSLGRSQRLLSESLPLSEMMTVLPVHLAENTAEAAPVRHRRPWRGARRAFFLPLVAGMLPSALVLCAE